MIDIISGTPDNLIIAVAHGKVTGRDYEEAFFPAIETKLKMHEKVRLLYQLGRDITGFTVEAMWDDAKLILKHLRAFEAIAIVTDTLWITDAAKVFSNFLRCPVRVFVNEEVERAKEWVATTPA